MAHLLTVHFSVYIGPSAFSFLMCQKQGGIWLVPSSVSTVPQEHLELLLPGAVSAFQKLLGESINPTSPPSCVSLQSATQPMKGSGSPCSADLCPLNLSSWTLLTPGSGDAGNFQPSLACRVVCLPLLMAHAECLKYLNDSSKTFPRCCLPPAKLHNRNISCNVNRGRV